MHTATNPVVKTAVTTSAWPPPVAKTSAVVRQPGEGELGAEEIAAVQAPLEHHDQRDDGEDHRQGEHRQHEGVRGAP